jgi:hypothetical protein
LESTLKKRKGQGSVEFIIIFSIFILIILSLWQAVGKDRIGEIFEEEIKYSAQEQAEKAFFAISSAHIGGDGFNTTLELDPKLENGILYNLTVYDDGFVAVDYAGRLYKIRIPTKNVTESVLNGSVTVSNINEVIYFE